MEWSEEVRARLRTWLPEDGKLGKDIDAALRRIEEQDRRIVYLEQTVDASGILANAAATKRAEVAEARVAELETRLAEAQAELDAARGALKHIGQTDTWQAKYERAEAALAAEQEQNAKNVRAYSEELEKRTKAWQAERERSARLQKAGVALLTKMDRIFASQEYLGIFTFAKVHGQVYTGECFYGETRAFRAALRDTAPVPHPFEPCHEGDEGDDPAHNFTCALLCVVCGLPREKHTAPKAER